MSKIINQSTTDLHIKIDKLTAKEKALLRLVFVDNINKVTLLWLYKVRYATFQNKLTKILNKLK